MAEAMVYPRVLLLLTFVNRLTALADTKLMRRASSDPGRQAFADDGDDGHNLDFERRAYPDHLGRSGLAFTGSSDLPPEGVPYEAISNTDVAQKNTGDVQVAYYPLRPSVRGDASDMFGNSEQDVPTSRHDDASTDYDGALDSFMNERTRNLSTQEGDRIASDEEQNPPAPLCRTDTRSRLPDGDECSSVPISNCETRYICNQAHVLFKGVSTLVKQCYECIKEMVLENSHLFDYETQWKCSPMPVRCKEAASEP